MDNGTEKMLLSNPFKNQTKLVTRDVNEPGTSQMYLENVDDLTKVCRTCATPTELNIPIFTGEGLENKIADKINKHLPIQVLEDDVLPQVVCYQCASTLIAYEELVQCCMQAETALKTRLTILLAKEKSKAEDAKKIDTMPKRKFKDLTEFVEESIPTDHNIISSDKSGDDCKICEYCGDKLTNEDYPEHLITMHSEQLLPSRELDPFRYVLSDDDDEEEDLEVEVCKKKRSRKKPEPVKKTKKGKSAKKSEKTESAEKPKNAEFAKKSKKTEPAEKPKNAESAKKSKKTEPVGKPKNAESAKKSKKAESANKIKKAEAAQQTKKGEHTKKSKKVESEQKLTGTEPAKKSKNAEPAKKPKKTKPAIKSTKAINPKANNDGERAASTAQSKSRDKKETTEINKKTTSSEISSSRNNEEDKDPSQSTPRASEHLEEDGEPLQINAPGEQNDNSEIFMESVEKLKIQKKKRKARRCLLCPREFLSSSNYSYHFRNVHGNKAFECDTCGKKFRTKQTIAQHTVIHIRKKRGAECKYCRKWFSSKVNLYSHEQIHLDTKKWPCSECASAFRWRAHLARHMKRHSTERPHVCLTCGRRFNVPCDLRRHMHTHKIGNFTCVKCNRRFSQLRYLRVHMRKKHNEIIDGD